MTRRDPLRPALSVCYRSDPAAALQASDLPGIPCPSLGYTVTPQACAQRARAHAREPLRHLCHPMCRGLLQQPSTRPERKPRRKKRHGCKHPRRPPQGARVTRSGRVFVGSNEILPCPSCRGWMSATSQTCMGCRASAGDKRAKGRVEKKRRGTCR